MRAINPLFRNTDFSQCVGKVPADLIIRTRCRFHPVRDGQTGLEAKQLPRGTDGPLPRGSAASRRRLSPSGLTCVFCSNARSGLSVRGLADSFPPRCRRRLKVPVKEAMRIERREMHRPLRFAHRSGPFAAKCKQCAAHQASRRVIGADFQCCIVAILRLVQAVKQIVQLKAFGHQYLNFGGVEVQCLARAVPSQFRFALRRIRPTQLNLENVPTGPSRPVVPVCLGSGRSKSRAIRPPKQNPEAKGDASR